MTVEQDELFMRAALQEARNGLYIAPPNPAVGCVLVRDGRIIARGFTHAPGSRHAEIDAIENAKAQGIDVRGATAYVTLEPCSHYGRTPPCALRLIDEGIGRVVAAMEDPNPLVAGRGLKMLQDAGVAVTSGVCRDEAYESNIGFFTRMRTGRPWVRLKTAVSLDGRSALSNGESRWITSEEARRRGRLWRARAQGILTGIGTVLSKLLSLTGMTFPIYIGAMIAAAIIRNVGEYSGQYTVYMGEINDIGGICLSLFLGMAMITLKLWQLAELALPLIVLLAGQTLFMILYVVLVVFNIMGRDYDAAVIVSGTCGFGMGATPNAMANMQAICDKYSPSVKAYLLIPLVGSLFADFLNSLVITVFINFI